MLVLCSNHSSKAFIAYARQHQGKLGWILGPSYWKQPRNDVPYALDNDAFVAWKNKTEWSEPDWIEMLDKTKLWHSPPIWVLVPDIVADAEGTFRQWAKYSLIASEYGWPLAFAVQDGMGRFDVPECDVVFVGGSTEWKWQTARMWCQHFPRVHIGRVRTGKLQLAEEMGAESVDGSGFMRETFHGRPARLLRAFVEGYRDTTLTLL